MKALHLKMALIFLCTAHDSYASDRELIPTVSACKIILGISSQTEIPISRSNDIGSGEIQLTITRKIPDFFITESEAIERISRVSEMNESKTNLPLPMNVYWEACEDATCLLNRAICSVKLENIASNRPLLEPNCTATLDDKSTKDDLDTLRLSIDQQKANLRKTDVNFEDWDKKQIDRYCKYMNLRKKQPSSTIRITPRSTSDASPTIVPKKLEFSIWDHINEIESCANENKNVEECIVDAAKGN